MKNNNQQPLIKRIKKVDGIFIAKFNKILEEGSIWDKKVIWEVKQGNKFIADDNNALFVAYWENNISGFLTAYRLQRFDKRKAEILIYDVGVDKNFRQKGIGKVLISEVKKWAKEVEADEVWVLTNTSNLPALALYKSSGESIVESDVIMFTFKI